MFYLLIFWIVLEIVIMIEVGDVEIVIKLRSVIIGSV